MALQITEEMFFSTDLHSICVIKSDTLALIKHKMLKLTLL